MNREILRLAIPNIISNISVPLLSTVDTALMGRMSELHLGAVGLGAMIFNFIYWNFGFLRMGTVGVTAQAFGKHEKPDIIHTLARALSLAVGIALLVIIFQIPFARMSFYLMNVSDNQYELISEYFHIRIWAAPATMGLYAFFGWFFGMQNAYFPLLLTVLINVINIGFNFLFVLGLGMDVDGVAWATVIAQYAGLLFAIGLFWMRYKEYLAYFQKQVFRHWEAFAAFIRINRDIFIRTVMLTLVFGFFYSQSAKSGDLVLAANVVLLQLVNWMSFGIDGFAYASESLVGKYKGADDSKKLKKAIELSFLWGGVVALFYSIIYWFLGNDILYLFTNQLDVITVSKKYLWWVIIIPLAGFASYIWDGVFIGLTASKAMRNSMLVAFLCFLGIYYLGCLSKSNHGLWLALTTFLFARGLVQLIMFYYQKLDLK